MKYTHGFDDYRVYSHYILMLLSNLGAFSAPREFVAATSDATWSEVDVASGSKNIVAHLFAAYENIFLNTLSHFLHASCSFSQLLFAARLKATRFSCSTSILWNAKFTI